MARTTRRTQGHCWGGDRPAGCDWEHHHILCCCSIHLGEGTGSESCQLLVKGEMGNQIPAVAPRDDKPTQVPPPSSASQSSAADLQLCSSVSHTLMPAPQPPVCIFSSISPSPGCCSCVSPFKSSFLLAHLQPSLFPAKGQVSLISPHQLISSPGRRQSPSRASSAADKGPTCSIPKGSTLLPSLSSSPNLPHSSSQPPTRPHLGTVGKYGRCKGPEIPLPHSPLTSKCALDMTNPLSVLTPMRSIPVHSRSKS